MSSHRVDRCPADVINGQLQHVLRDAFVSVPVCKHLVVSDDNERGHAELRSLTLFWSEPNKCPTWSLPVGLSPVSNLCLVGFSKMSFSKACSVPGLPSNVPYSRCSLVSMIHVPLSVDVRRDLSLPFPAP